MIELLIAVVIIGILSTIIYVNWANVQARARDNKRKADLQAVSSAMKMYYVDNNKYMVRPSGSASLVPEKDYPSTSNVAHAAAVGIDRTGYDVSDLSELLTNNYIFNLPEDPLSKPNKLCKYMYLKNDDDTQQYKLLSTSAEALGNNYDQCESNAAEFSNSQYHCKFLQVSSSTISKYWNYLNAEVPADIEGCANGL